MKTKNNTRHFDTIEDYFNKKHEYLSYMTILGDDRKTLKALVKTKSLEDLNENNMKDLDLILDGYKKDTNNTISKIEEIIIMGNTFIPLTQLSLFKNTKLKYKQNLS